MNLRLTLSLVLAIFGSLCHQAPATSPKQYELGTTYTYSYTSVILLNEPPPLLSNRSLGAEVGYQIAATVDLTSIWQDSSNPNHILLELSMKSPKLSIRSRKVSSADGFIPHSSPLDDQPSASIFLDWNDGVVNRIFAAESETTSSLNLKKGVASLFQVHFANKEVEETDSSGHCTVSYQQRGEQTLLKKKRYCTSLRPAQSPTFARTQQILGVSSSTENQWKYNLKKGLHVVEALTATEVHSLRVALRSQAGASVISRQFLHLSGEAKSKTVSTADSVEEVVQSAATGAASQFVEDNLEIIEDTVPQCQGSSCQSFPQAVNELKSHLLPSKLAKVAAAEAFVKLVPIARRSSKSDVLSVLNNAKNKKILPQLLDVLAAAQTEDCHRAVTEVVNFKSQTDIELPERYLVAVSLSTHPSEYLIKDLLKLCSKKIPSANLAQTATLSLAAVTKTYHGIHRADASRQTIVSEVRQHFLNALDACKSGDCRQLNLRALKNLAMAETLAVVMKYIGNKDKKTSVEAIKALRALPPVVFDPVIKRQLEKIYFQIDRRYDSSARTFALDMLLQHEPTSEFILAALSSLSSRQDKEMNTYTLQRMIEFAGNNPAIRSQMKRVLADNHLLNNYHVLAQDGLSTAFTRLMYRDLNGNGTFSSSNEVVNGVMKRSAFDIFLTNSEDSLQVLSFGLFTGGLSSLMGGSSDGDEEDPTAGMEIILSDVQLRPLIFFEGQGELMGHVWSGTASERTSALQATVLLQDHRQLIPLQSGFFAVLDVLGSVSFDFGGEIQISIWNRNSHSVVDNMAAWALEGSLGLSTSFVKSDVEFKVDAEAKIDFVSDVSFGDGLLACLRMGQNGFKINQVVQKRESIPGTKHWIHKRKARQEIISGRTYTLNDKNSILCNQMFA